MPLNRTTEVTFVADAGALHVTLSPNRDNWRHEGVVADPLNV
ncbi:hypothetical protein BN77_0840 [Rhizobium mesoamericanum STM3625]|uniref:Uncharacterized protein n=1 Tax=Rhizobium mesoamericanum STM3625 TaxID=1211777 RepID=K0Q0X6_9HYPH|nr:hypothetical protein BN77_0840 [Rhizobium mesoamericanum STM3625]